MSLGGFLGSDNTITLNQFIALVKKGEIRYVMSGGQGGGGDQGSSNSISEIMSWVQKNGTAILTCEYSNTSATTNTSGTTTTITSAQNSNTSATTQDTNSTNSQSSSSTTSSTNSEVKNSGGFGGGNSGQLYDLKAYTDANLAK